MLLCYRCESERRRRSDEFYDSSVIADSMAISSNAARVYVLVRDNGTRYVGKSGDVNRRISQHLNPKASPSLRFPAT